MSVTWGPGFHAATGQPVDSSAYEQYIGRWSRLFVPELLDAARVSEGNRVLDVATGTGEAARLALQRVGISGLVVGVDISPEMLQSATARLSSRRFLPVLSDAQMLVFPDASFDAVVCQLGLMFLPDPARGLAEFRRVLRTGCCAAVCVVSTPDRAPMWGILAEALGRRLPEQRTELHKSFALADVAQLEGLFLAAGFRDVRATRATHEGTLESFDEYWAPIETGPGQLPQAYRALPELSRRAVREEVQTRLSRFELDGRLKLSAEMLIGVGCA
jgi:ubiquinone/menaquinone biosynthesis C-methylase UbiE